MDESIEQVRNDRPPPDVRDRQYYEESRREELRELDRRMERPPEEGKGQNVDVFA